jgi:HSP20 family molecular chaperone IbpA
MNNSKTKSLEAREKRGASVSAEHMGEGLTFTPAVDIFETDNEITLVADMPGVKADDLSIDLDDNILTLAGDVESAGSPNETVLFEEYQTGKYFRQFTLSEVIDQAKIEASLEDGVLRLRLPKVEPAKPRKITVKSA